MIDWNKWNREPTEENLSQYPTIIDVIESIIEDEEMSLGAQSPICPTTMIHLMGRPGNYFMVHDDKDKSLTQLIPTSYSPFTYYRGQSKYYQECKPSILRYINDRDVFLANLQEAELEVILRHHPIINDISSSIIQHPRISKNLYLPIHYKGLAQHYGIPTSFMDLTNEKWVAAFFAVSKYENNKYKKINTKELLEFKDKFGVFYRLNYDNAENNRLPSTDGISPIGLQYFNRPGRQSAFVIDLSKVKDLHKIARIEKIFFRHDNFASDFIFNMSLKSKLYFPNDSLGNIAEELRRANTFSKTAISQLQKDLNLTDNEMEAKLNEYNISVSSMPTVNFDRQTIQKDWEIWQNEGKQRYYKNILLMPVINL